MKLTKYIIRKLLENHKLPNKVYKWLPKNWTDDLGNNLYHYALLNHDLFLYEQAKLNQVDIHQKNVLGIRPIHRYIEGCFPEKEDSLEEKKNKIAYENAVRKKSLIKYYLNRPDFSLTKITTFRNREVDFNEELFDLIIKDGVNINAFIENPKASGQWGEGVATFSKNNTMGSPLELLIGFFWDKVHYNNYKDNYDNYLKLYNMLSAQNANINKITELTDIVINDVLTDAMQTDGSIIVSHFFTKYIANQFDLSVILPIFQDKNINFTLKDDSQNTLLHHLFGRLSSREHVIEYDAIYNLFNTIMDNPNFNKDYLYIKNSFNIPAINLLRGDSKQYISLFENMILKEKLENKFSNMEMKKTKAVKI